MTEDIQMGKIYKRKEILASDEAYPEYIVPTSICDRLDDQYRYNFFDMKRAKQSGFIIRQRIIDKFYELQE